jgi:general secretion pathway protein G
MRKLKTALNNMFRSQSGFTLIEIMIAVTIIAILGAFVVPKLMDMPQRARQIKAKQDINSFQLSLTKYNMENAVYPSTEEGLQKLVDEKYLENKKGTLLDPWGNPYYYRYPGESDPDQPELWSLGADGREGGEAFNADIKSWE